MKAHPEPADPPPRTRRRKWGRAVPAALLSLLLTAQLTGALDRGLDALGRRRITQANARYIEEASSRAADVFAVLTLFKTGLSVIEGSTLGVSFGVAGDIQAGDVVQAILDYIDVAWKTVLAGMVVLFSTRLLLNVAADLAPGLLTAGIILLAIHLFIGGRDSRRWPLRNLAAPLAAFTLTLAVTLHAVLPLSLYAASRLSQRFTTAEATEAAAQIACLKDEILPPPDPQADSGIRERVKALAARIKAVGDRLGEWLDRLSRSVVRLIAAYLFDCVLFPIGFFLTFLWLLRTFMARLVGAGQRRRSLAELEKLLQKCLTPTPTV